MEAQKRVFNYKQPKVVPKVIEKKEDGDIKPIAPANVSTVLMKLKCYWPFDLAPDEIIIEEERMIIKINYFPIGNTIISIPIEKITRFEVTTDIFFSAVHIVDADYIGNNIKIKWLNPSEAYKAKILVDGLQLKNKRNIEIPTTKKDTYVRTVRAIGEI